MDHKYIAVMGMSNTISIGIIDIEYSCDDVIVFSWHNGEKSSRKSRSLLRIDKEGEGYFISKGMRFYLNQFIKV